MSSSPPLSSALSAPKATLLAVNLASTAELPQLHSLVTKYPTTFTTQTLLRVLLALPEATPPESYAPFIDHALSSSLLPDTELKVDTKSIAGVTDKQAKRMLRKLLPALDSPSEASNEEWVVSFLITRSLRIDTELGALDIITSLLGRYNLPQVRNFLKANVVVLEKLVYEYSREPIPSLDAFRRMEVREALEILIADPTTVARDLNVLVEPYLSVEEEGKWKHVWERLSALPFANIGEVVKDWTPPPEVKTQFCAWAMSVCYRCPSVEGKTWDIMHGIHKRISGIMDGSAEDGVEPEVMGDLLDLKNPLVQPTTNGLRLLSLGITSAAMLSRPLAEVQRLRLEGAKEVQLAVLRQFVRSGVQRDDEAWKKVRDGARWLRTKSEALGKLAAEEVEKIVLPGMLDDTRFDLARRIYVESNGGLSLEDVEKCVLDAFVQFVDNATNGNRTRGRMKSALQWYGNFTLVVYILLINFSIQILYPKPSTSPALERAYRLISATHALSSYSLVLSPGQPLLPVHIRNHPDPISLLPRLLDSNRRSYLQPDALVSIAQDLAQANSTSTPVNNAAIEARVLGMATEAALGDDDFETAYSYVMTRLLPSATAPAPSRQNDTPSTEGIGAARDTLWRTSLHAGRFRSTLSTISSAPPRGATTLKLLEKKLELLALALRFCPAVALPDCLAQWQKCEADAEECLAADARAEEEFVKKAEGIRWSGEHERPASQNSQRQAGWGLPGVGLVGGVLGHHSQTGNNTDTRPTGRGRGEEEAPQSLFDVAKAAGSLLGGEGRKREAVKGAVTKGLVGGLGWVLGVDGAARGQH